jgi:hypothetical protein
VQAREHHLGGRDALLVHVHGDPAAVVADRHAAVAVERDVDARGVAGLRLVDRVVDDLEGHVVQAGAVVGVADVHARPLADGIQALEDGDGRAVVVGATGGAFGTGQGGLGARGSVAHAGG